MTVRSNFAAVEHKKKALDEIVVFLEDLIRISRDLSKIVRDNKDTEHGRKIDFNREDDAKL